MNRSRSSLLAETLALCAFCLALLFWIIPRETSEGGFGLSPAFMPTACTTALLALVLVDGAQRLLRRPSQAAYASGWSAMLLILGLAVAGAVVLRVAGIAASAAAIPAAGMLMLGERRPLIVAAVVALCGGAFWLVFR